MSPFAHRRAAARAARPARRRPQSVRAAAAFAVEALEGRRLFSAAYGLNLSNGLFTFDTATPGTVTPAVPLSGVTGTILAIDVRPSNGVLYGLGVDGTDGRLYAINPQTGVSTSIGAAFPVSGTGYGIDFNPAVDLLRVTSDDEINFRVNPDTGAVSPDTGLAFAAGDPNAGDDPEIVGIAYTNNVAGAASTSLFGLDFRNDALVRIDPPNSGSLLTVGPTTRVSVNSAWGFDIETVGGVDTAYASIPTGVGTPVYGLYTVNLGTGAATPVGAIGPAGFAVRDIAIRVGPAAPATLVVTNADDAGPGSLRGALTLANALPGPQTVTFAIPGAGVQTITLASDLPFITDTVTIDGYTQPGSSPNTLGAGGGSNAVIKVELDANRTGGGTLADALTIDGGNGSLIRGLSIGNARLNGIAVNADDVVIAGNFIGLRADGRTPFLNAQHGVLFASGDEHRVGGTAPADRNVISNNNRAGIRLTRPTLIQGNLIGLDATGTIIRGNGDSGILAEGTTLVGSLIGGNTPAARNVISGNGSAGVRIATGGSAGTAFPILSNYIGTDVTGTLDLGNLSSGVSISFMDGVTIGAPGAGNLIRFNDVDGVGIGFGSDAVLVGNTVRDNGGDGISINQGNNVVVGGTAPGAGNVIAGNRAVGVDFSGPTIGARIQGNLIGTDSTGADLGNAGPGVQIGSLVFDVVIGGPVPAAGNTIAFNAGDGVAVGRSGDPSTAEVRLNSIYSNDGLGIDLANDGVTPNDAGDPDGSSSPFQPNSLQNFPVLASAIASGGATTVQGSLNSGPGTNYLIDFYANAAFDPSTFGEGHTYLGSVAVTTNGSGNATYAASFPVLPVGQFITATATTADTVPGVTSEFSQPVQVIAPPTPPNPTISVAADVGQNEGTGANTTIAFTVTRTGDTTAASTVNFATADATAANGSDYFGQSGTLSFAAGETSKTVNVSVVADSAVETDEQFVLNLTGATGGTIGDNQQVATIVNDDFPPPTFSIDDVTLAEGNGAGTTAFTFTVTRSGVAGSLANASRVQVATAPGTAASPGDYAAVAPTTLNFAAGVTTQTVTVNVTRDTTSEADETFFVNLSNPVNGTITDAQGLGTISNDDVAVATAVFGPDPGQSGKTALIITGTPGNDVIDLDAGSSSSKVKVYANDLYLGEFSTSSISRLYIFALDGDDHVAVTTKYTKDSVLVGGTGNDDMKGGYGKDVMIGGDGNDTLSGRRGRDVIIGGIGGDGLSGNEDDDLLVAGATTYDTSFADLLAVQKEWTSSNGYSTRVSRLKSGSGSNLGGRRLNDTTIVDDLSIDLLNGASGSDAFFVQTSSGPGVVKDNVTDKSGSEIVTDVQ